MGRRRSSFSQNSVNYVYVDDLSSSLRLGMATANSSLKFSGKLFYSDSRHRNEALRNAADQSHHPLSQTNAKESQNHCN